MAVPLTLSASHLTQPSGTHYDWFDRRSSTRCNVNGDPLQLLSPAGCGSPPMRLVARPQRTRSLPMPVAAPTVLPLSTRHFPGLHQGRLSRRRTYLDSACLTPVAAEVAAAVQEYYRNPPGCPLRNNSGRSGEIEERIREARDSVRSFLNAKFSDEIVFTPNTTFGINLLAGGFRHRPGKVLI